MTDEKRGYSKGYAAGRKRLKSDGLRVRIAALKEEFIQRMMLEIAAEQIRNPWRKKVNGEWKTHTTAEAMMSSVRLIAEAAADTCEFYSIAQGMEAPQGVETTGSTEGDSPVAESEAP